ncbi:hypothetical protein ACJJTC_015972 [Scirpophaga incertulas]
MTGSPQQSRRGLAAVSATLKQENRDGDAPGGKIKYSLERMKIRSNESCAISFSAGCRTTSPAALNQAPRNRARENKPVQSANRLKLVTSTSVTAAVHDARAPPK